MKISIADSGCFCFDVAVLRFGSQKQLIANVRHKTFIIVSFNCLLS